LRCGELGSMSCSRKGSRGEAIYPRRHRVKEGKLGSALTGWRLGVNISW
jgi:hypothetical protein